MSALDLLEDGFPHGTREGWEQGCRGKHCPSLEEHGISCTDARLRYQGDYRFRKRVDAGLSVAEIAAAEREDTEAEKAAAVAVRAQERANRAVAVVKPKRAPRASAKRPAETPLSPELAEIAERVKARLQEDAHLSPKLAEVVASVKARLENGQPVKPVRKKRASGPLKHGSMYAWQQGCRTIEGCPNHALGEPTCVEVNRKYHREYLQKRRERAGQGLKSGAIRHGTPAGYQLGCHDRDACPGVVSCADASLAEERRRRREAGVPAAPVVVDSGEVVAHLARLHDQGLGPVTIARRTGVSKSSVRDLIYGRSDRGYRISANVEAEKARRLLAFKPWEQS